MKYFKHDLMAFDNDKVWDLIEVHGMQGYGIWWWLLEKLYAAEPEGFQISATQTWFKRSSKAMNLTDWRTLVRVLDTFAEIGLISAQLWAEHTIHAEGIKNRAENYIRQRELATERKRKQRVRSTSDDPNVTREIEAVTRDIEDVTACHGGVTTNVDVDLDLDLKQTPLPPSQGEVDCPNSLTLPAASEGVSAAPVQGAKPEAKKGSKAKGSETPAFEDFREAYNRERPHHWPEMQVVNSKRQRAFKQLIRDLGGRTRAIEAMSDALNFAKTEDWYQKRSLTFENFASHNKIIQLSESFSEQPDSGLPDIHASIGAENLRLGLTGYLSAEWRQRFGKSCVVELDLGEARDYLAALRTMQEVRHAC